MNADENTRFDRIEEKIDKMADAIIALARAEEKISNLDETTRVILNQMVAQEERLREVEQSQIDSGATLKTIKSVTWTFVSTIITGLGASIIWLLGFPESK
jgi:uncharacterized protein YerC